MENKYKINIPQKDINKNIGRLTNQLWKLIPMRENKEDWVKQLNTVALEISGLYQIFDTPLFLQILCKLEGLKTEETDFLFYRKTIFEAIDLLQKCTI